ncbi:hypothetical protein GCK72_003201 [Caenorhabditis remanei]|uniref:Uncharacterized protein n=1 Tax=Caenorhabditis remanei TaxID=31234 RepID=A0A6A5HUS6_CAERE|nr:hypothetical protein GCK72_003201 [Caenorhabditis remanei]KAF1771375.1 hypothetical protein GCK72_003201 [Caenorhabditis remanei]
MNNSIGIALLLLFASAQSVAGVKRNSPDVLSNRDLVNSLNKQRLIVARQDQIANMHDVTYDDTLENKLKKMTCDDLASPGSDYVVFNYLDLIFQDSDPMKTPQYHPLQTKIGCGPPAAVCGDQHIMCLMGPKNSPVKESDIKHGSPGTGCSGGDGSSGLCMGGGGGAVKNQSDKKSGDSDVESKGSKDGEEAASSAAMPMALLSLALGIIMA